MLVLQDKKKKREEKRERYIHNNLIIILVIFKVDIHIQHTHTKTVLHFWFRLCFSQITRKYYKKQKKTEKKDANYTVQTNK